MRETKKVSVQFMAAKPETVSEVKSIISEAGIQIAELFDDDTIKSSEIFKKERQSAHEHAKRVERSLGEERERIITLTKSLEEKDGKIKTLNEIVSKTKTKELFGKAKDIRKLDDKEAAYIEKRLGGFKSDKESDDLNRDFDKFLDEQLTDFQETAKLFGIEVKKGDDKKDKGGAPNSDGKGDSKDLASPDNNEFIPR